MNLLKAIGRTALSLLKWLTIMTLIVGGIVGSIIALRNPSVSDIVACIFIGILLLTLLGLVVLSIVMSIQDNYEKYARKSVKTEKSFKIDYNIVCERNRIVSGKTKKQAIENLYNKELDCSEDLDSHYRIVKVKEIK